MTAQNSQSVLIVNDAADQLELTEYILRQAGYRVYKAAGGGEGFETARREKPDLIISDVLMPDGGGLKLCRMIRDDAELCPIPIMLVSAKKSDTESFVEGFEAGADDYLQLPYEPLILLARASRLLERSRMESEMREKNRRSRLLIENTTDVISIVAPDGTLIFGSPSVKNVYGYELDEIIGTQIAELVHPEDQKAAADFLHRALRSFTPIAPIQTRFRHKNGSWINIESVAQSCGDPVHGIVGIINSRDVTEQRNALKTRIESENRLRVIFGSAVVGILVIGPDFRLVDFNSALEKMLGYSEAELSKMSFVDFTHPDDISVDGILAEHIFRGERDYYQIEKRYIKKNGGVMWANVSAAAVKNEDNQTISITNMIEDITARKVAEFALRKSEERFRAQYKGIPIPTYTLQKTGDDFIFVDYNRAADEVSRHKIGRFVGSHANEFFQGQPEVLDNIRRCFEQRTTVRHGSIFQLKTKNSIRHLDVTYVFVPPDFVMIHSRDITDQVNAEETLRRRENRFQMIYRATNDLLWDWDLQTGALWLNEVYGDLVGDNFESEYSAIDLRYQAIHPEDRRRIVESVRAVIESGGQIWSGEYRLCAADGSTIYVFDRGYIVYENGKAMRMIGAATNITERKSAEETLQIEQSRLQKQNRTLNALTEHQQLFHEPPAAAIGKIIEISAQILEVARVSVWLYNAERTEIRTIDAYESTSGTHGDGQILTKKDYPKYFDALAKNVGIASDDAQTDERMAEFAESYLKPRGITAVIKIPIRIGGVMVGLVCHEHTVEPRKWKLDEQNFAGSLAGLISLLLEADERRQAENALRESREHLQLAQQVALIGSYEFDFKTGTGNASAALEALYDAPPGSLNRGDKNWTKHLHPDDAAQVGGKLKKLIADGELESEFRVVLKNGGLRWLYSKEQVFYDDEHRPQRLVGVNMDVTERKQIEQKIRESEEQYRLLFDSNPLPMWVFDRRTLKFLTVNDAAVNCYGYSREEFLAMSVLEIRPAADVQIFLDHLSKIETLGDHKGFWKHCKKNGELIDVEITSHEFAFAGQPAELVLANDVTERKKSEDAIRFQANLLDTVEQSVIAANLDGTIIYWNRFAHELYGYSAAEAVGRSVTALITPDTEHPHAERLMSGLSAGKSWSGEFTVKTKDGKVFPAQIFNTPVRNGDGKLTGIIGVSFDITERKNAETAIVEANNRAIFEYDRLLQRISTLAQTLGTARDLSAVFSAIQDFAQLSVPCSALIVSLYDAESHSRRIIYLWYDDKEMTASEFAPVPVGEGLIDQAVKSGEVVTVDDFRTDLRPTENMVLFGSDKDEREPRSMLIAPMKIMGKVLGTIEVQSYEPAAYRQEHATAMRMAANLAANSIENVRLIELDRQNAEQRRLSQRLESVGRLAGGIAHDFNNMLTAINGYSDLTLRRLAADDPLRRNVEEIKKAGQRSAELTYQLLAFSRLQVLKPRVLAVNEVVAETIQMLERLIGEDVQLNLDLDPQIGAVEADPGQLTQVIVNLAVNARDAMPNGGSLTIQTRNIELDEDYAARHFPIRPGAFVMLEVTDTGSGIDDEVIEHIFEPFYTTKEVGKGTGLGLATVYGIVKQSGGFIWADSEIGDGTSFKIYLPRVDRKSSPEETANAADNAPHGAETILIVEDEDLVRDMSRQILEECGYTIIEARNGIEALEIVRNATAPIDLLLTDVVMPLMGGRELSEKLTRTHPQIAVLFTSGYTDDAIIRQGIVETNTNFIEKPFTYNGLAQKVRQVLDTPD